MGELGPKHIRERYPSLAGRKIYAKLGEAHDDEELEALELLYRRVVALYAGAAQSKHSMLAIVVKSED